MTKKQWEEIIGHYIRMDTYTILDRMVFKQEKYEDIVKEINNKRAKYGLKKDTIIVSKKTIDNYIGLYDVVQDKEKEIDYDKATGVYGIYVNDKLVYIGQTANSFKARFQNHKSCLKSSDQYLYRFLRVAKGDITLKPLIVVEELKIAPGIKIKERDIKMMELALIDLYKPICNLQGNTYAYQI